MSGTGTRYYRPTTWSGKMSTTAVSGSEVIETIASFHREHDYILDPHTAVGVKAAQKFKTIGVPMVCLATAHPAKFGETVAAAIGKPPQVPEALAGILDKPSRCEIMDADKTQIQDFVAKNALTTASAKE